MGETGTGKTTLLDAFVNKIASIDYADSWRYRLVDESDLAPPAGQSRTQEINEYFINDDKNVFNLRIFDSPGYGDTRGIKVDQEITDKFRKLFQSNP